MSMKITRRVRVGLALNKRGHAGWGVIISLALAPALLFAQSQVTSTTSAGSTADENLESVVVTGSRIARGGFETPTPVSVVGADRIEQRAASNIGDLLNEIPAFRPTNTPASTGLGAAANYVGGRIL